jgi:hypothetical protein
MRSRGIVLITILSAAPACVGDDATMQVRWIHGTDTVSLALPATAVSCPDLGWLEVVGATGDTGVGLVVFPPGEVTGRYVVEPPAWREDSATSVAGIAVRWFSADGVFAFAASDGVVQLEQTGQLLSGRLVGRLQDIMGTDSMELQGTFANVAIRVGGIECDIPPDTTDVGAADSSVD